MIRLVQFGHIAALRRNTSLAVLQKPAGICRGQDRLPPPPAAAPPRSMPASLRTAAAVRTGSGTPLGRDRLIDDSNPIFGLLPTAAWHRPWVGAAFGLWTWFGLEAVIASALGLGHHQQQRGHERLVLVADHLLCGLILSGIGPSSAESS
jgi:hypothetical protein